MQRPDEQCGTGGSLFRAEVHEGLVERRNRAAGPMRLQHDLHPFDGMDQFIKRQIDQFFRLFTRFTGQGYGFDRVSDRLCFAKRMEVHKRLTQFLVGEQ